MASSSEERLILEQVDKLRRQNEILKNQLELRKGNADSKTANILAQISCMIEELNHSIGMITRSSESRPKNIIDKLKNQLRPSVGPAFSTSGKLADPGHSIPAVPKDKAKASENGSSVAGAGKDGSRDLPLTRGSRDLPLTQSDLGVPSTSHKAKYGDDRTARDRLRYQSTPGNDDHPSLGSIGLSPIYEDAIQGREKHERKVSWSHDDLLTSTRIIGEIAFQLDRRILSYVFDGHCSPSGGRQRFYGFTIQNIDEMIDRECRKNHKMDEQVRLAMRHRFEYIVGRLKTFGYDINYHPPFSTKMVNQFGLLNLAGECLIRRIKLQDPETLHAAVVKIAPKDVLKDILILLDCLVLLSNDEGKPLFLC